MSGKKELIRKRDSQYVKALKMFANSPAQLKVREQISVTIAAINRREEQENPSRDLWRCPVCQNLNAWSWSDAERANALLVKLYGLPEGSEPVKIAHGSCFDNICGHCSANVVKRDSPILAPCYTHEED